MDNWIGRRYLTKTCSLASREPSRQRSINFLVDEAALIDLLGDGLVTKCGCLRISWGSSSGTCADTARNRTKIQRRMQKPDGELEGGLSHRPVWVCVVHD